jgi:hypothetical protein
MISLLEAIWHMVKESLRLPASVAAYAALVGVIVGTFLAFGVFPPIFGGFARTTTVNSIALQNNIHWSYEVEDSLLRMDQEKCAADPNSKLRRMYDRLIQDRENEYMNLTGRNYDLPRCSEL